MFLFLCFVFTSTVVMLSKVFNSVLFGIYVLRNVVALYALDGDVSLWYGIIANLAYTAGLYIL